MSTAEFAVVGGQAVGSLLCESLRAEGRRPYLIPVGGSNALGTWGYLDAVAELEAQLGEGPGGQGAGQGGQSGDVGVLPARFDLCLSLSVIMRRRRCLCMPHLLRFDHVAFACGSGGTAAGLGLGFELSGLRAAGTRVHAIGVCDTPQW